MKKLKRVSAFLFAGMTLMSASEPGHALGFGRPFSRAVLGDTLTVTVPLRLEAGEEISDECLAADVFFGEDKVLASAIRTVVQPGEGDERVLKVSTTAIVNEPVVTVYLAAGCKARMTRKFVAFADPPGIVMPTGGDPTSTNVAETGQGADKPVRSASSSGRAASSRGASASLKSARAGNGSVRSPSTGLDASGSSDAPVMSARAARVLTEPEGDAAGSRSSLRAASTLVPDRAEQGTGGRLVLDGAPTEPVSLHDLRMTSSLGVMLQADDQSPEVLARRRTAAALWLALNATPEEMARDRQRLSDLEQRLTQLTAENQRARQALAEAQGLGGSGKWLALLALIALAALGVAIYLARKLKSAPKGQDAWWHSQTDSRLKEPTSEAPSTDVERTSAFVRTPPATGSDAPARSRVEPVGGAAAAKTPARPGSQPASGTYGTAAAPTAPSPLNTAPSKQALHELVPDAPGVSSLATSAPAVLASRSAEPLREVSVEELIDLEQQAEFFVVLGQDDAAIGLLESHVTNTTGASPLPFLKLLEIYRRLGRRGDYDRVQSQFNLRFNAHAPSWESDLQQGHSLDEYPGVVERLQALWATPVKAMEVLEKSLTRPDASADTFELPAYRELLFLYAVARDLSEREPHERANVDLLLPSLDGDADEGEPTTMPSGGAELEDSGEPLMATRPIKAQPEAMPSMNLDFHLDDLPEPSDMTTKH